jgi:hypothetical protein
MLITRKSRRRSKRFHSRFDQDSPDFPLRQYYRCREDMISSLVMAVLLAGFVVVLFILGHVLWQVFAVHGRHLNPLYRVLVFGGLFIVILIVVRRLWLRLQNAREARAEMHELARRLERRNDEAKGGGDAPPDSGSSPPA